MQRHFAFSRVRLSSFVGLFQVRSTVRSTTMFARLVSLVAAVLLSFVAAAALATPIPGAVVWFDASDVDGDGNSGNNPSNGASVQTWVDKAGTVQGVQSATNNTPSQQPTFVTSFQNGQS